MAGPGDAVISLVIDTRPSEEAIERLVKRTESALRRLRKFAAAHPNQSIAPDVEALAAKTARSAKRLSKKYPELEDQRFIEAGTTKAQAAIRGTERAEFERRSSIPAQMAYLKSLTPGDIKAKADLKVRYAQLDAQIKEELASSGQYAKAKRRAAAATEEIARQTKTLQLKEYFGKKGGLTKEGKRRLQVDSENQLGANLLKAQQQKAYFAEVAAYNKRAIEQAALPRDAKGKFAKAGRTPQTVEQITADAQIGLKLFNEKVKALVYQSQALAEAMAQSAIAERERAARIQSVKLNYAESGAGRELAKREATNFARQELVTAKDEIARIEAINALSEEDKQLMAQRVAQERILNAEMNRRVEAEIAARTATQEQAAAAAKGAATQAAAAQQNVATQGSLFQRLQYRIASRQGRATGKTPLDYQTGKQFLGSKLLTTGGFLVSGSLFYGAIQGAREVGKELTSLQQNFALIQEQLQQAGKGGEFNELRSGILATARETGILGSELAFLGLQLRGAFNDKPIAFVNDQLRAAARIARVTGLPLSEITDSLTGLVKSFEGTGLIMQQIGDVAVGLQQKFGVLAKETITFTADLAPTAKEAGLSFRDLAAIGATAQRNSARGGAALAEAFGRILPTIQENAADILTLFDQLGDEKRFKKVADALGAGETGKVLKEIIGVYDELTGSQQKFITSALGGRREAPFLNAILSDAKELDKQLKSLDRNPGQFAGRLNQQFSRLQGTIGQQLARLKQQFLQLGVALANSTIVPILQDVFTVLQSILQIINPILHGFGSLNKALSFDIGNFKIEPIKKLVEALLLLKGISMVKGAGGVKSIGGGIANVATFGLFGVMQQRRAAAASQAAQLAAVGEAGIPVPRTLATKPGLLGRLGGSLGLTGGGVGGAVATVGLTAAITAGFVGMSSWMGLRKSLDQKADDLKAKIQSVRAHQGTKGLKALADELSKGEQSFWTRLKYLAGGEKLPSEQVNDARQKILGKQYKRTLEKLAERSHKRLMLPTIQIPNGGRGGSWSGRGGAASGPPELVERPLTIQEFLDSAQGDLTDDQIFKQYQKAYTAALKGVPGAKSIAARVIKYLKKNFKASEANAASEILDVKTMQQYYEAGLVGTNEFQARIQATLATLKTTVARARRRGKNPSPEIIKSIQELEGMLDETVQVAIDAADALLRQREISGRGPGGLAELAILMGTLRSKALRKSPLKRLELINRIEDALVQSVQKRIDAVEDTAKKLAIAKEGIPYPAGLKLDKIKVLLDPKMKDFGSQYIKSIAQNRKGDEAKVFAQLSKQIQYRILIQGQTLQKAILAELRAERERLRGLIRATKAAIQGIREAGGKAAKGIINILSIALKGFQGEFKDAQEKVRQAKTDALLAAASSLVDNLDKISVDADTQAGLANDAAKETDDTAKQIRDGQRALVEAWQELAQAKLDLAKAFVSNDPVAAAKIEQQKIDAQIAFLQAQAASLQEDVATAKDDQERLAALTALAQNQAAQIQAQASRVEADHQLRDAVLDIVYAQIEYALAVAEAAGDMVGSAEVQLRLAKEKLANEMNNPYGVNEAEVTRLKADVIRQQAALRDAALQDKIETIQFNLETEKISKQQAIAQYEALLASADTLQLTEQQRRNLILEIRRLREDLSRDLQFNLPSELRLPTLYEARRLNQTGGMYQDNRSITISLSSTDPESTQQAVDQIYNELSAPPVYGSGTRIY